MQLPARHLHAREAGYSRKPVHVGHDTVVDAARQYARPGDYEGHTVSAPAADSFQLLTESQQRDVCTYSYRDSLLPLNGPVVPTELSISPPPCAVASIPDATGPLSDENTTSASHTRLFEAFRKKMQHDA